MQATAAVNKLIQNISKAFDDASYALLRYTSNIIKEPSNIRYRTIKTVNEVFKSRILPVDGAVDCLLAMGFEKREESYVLPLKHCLEDLKQVHEALIAERNRRNLKVPQQASAKSQSSVQRPPPVQVVRQQPTPQMIKSEEMFYAKLEKWSRQVMVYENKDLQDYALMVIPLEELKLNAVEGAKNELQDATGQDAQDAIIMDYLLLEMLNWFKNSFFSWVDQPACSFCDGQTINSGSAAATTDDLMWDASHVEVYQCTICNRFTRFPRYNHPRKLLETRKGRCGEWANCFTLCCHAVGLEARFVVDWTDHVWTEVFSKNQQRWLHCDSCENICDKPLLYELGWGKKLSYIIAFSKDLIVDVTWRYTAKAEEVRQRRQECRESWLIDTITRMNNTLQISTSSDRLQLLQMRSLAEMFEFLAPKQIDETGYTGRTSGSLAWRQARGEVETGTIVQDPLYIFELNEQEITARKLRYCAATDTYLRSNEDDYDKHCEMKGWQKYAYKIDSIFRKVEHDWKMVYLARVEGSNCARLSWKIDLSSANLAVNSVSILASTATYEDGCVTWTIEGENGAKKSWEGGRDVVECPELRNCQQITLSVFLTGGKGDTAWQHTQLFRQSINTKNDCLLDIQLDLISK